MPLPPRAAIGFFSKSVVFTRQIGYIYWSPICARFFTQIHMCRFLLALLLLGLGNAGAFAQYCLPTYANDCSFGDYIDGVSIANLSNTGTGCTGILPNNNTYYSTDTVYVTVGANYTLTVNNNPDWEQGMMALIDFNGDQDFDDPGEFFDLGLVSPGATATVNISIPGTAVPGNTRMRVMCDYSNPLIQADVCATNLGLGEVEDYPVVIAPPSSLDGGVAALASPTGGCGLTANEPVTITVANFGTDTLFSTPVAYSVNGGAPVTETINDTILPAGTYDYTFVATADLSVPQAYNFSAYTDLPGDGNNANDTLSNATVQSIPLVNTLPYAEDFESGPGGWAVEGTNASWAFGTPAKTVISGAASGVNAWVTGGLGTGDYNANEASYVVSPCFDLSGVALPQVSLAIWHESESGWDGAVLQVSTDGGNTWENVGAFGDPNNWYNEDNLSGIGAVSPNGDGWAGDGPDGSGGYILAQNNVPQASNESNVRFRVGFGSDAAVQTDGIAFDDFSLTQGATFNDYALVGANLPQGCDLSSTEVVEVVYANVGSDTLTAGDQFDFSYILDANPTVTETFTLVDSLLPGDTVTYQFSATADLSAPGAYSFDFWLSQAADTLLANDTLLAQQLSSKPAVNTYPYFEDFELGNGGWLAGGANSSWAFGLPAKNVITGAASGDSAWVTGGLDTLEYNVNENSFVEGPCFDMTPFMGGNPHIAATIWWDSESGFDGTVLQYSTDSGATWQNVGGLNAPAFYNWFNESGILGNPGGQDTAWAGSSVSGTPSGQYVRAVHPLPVALTMQNDVRFRFAFGSDGSVTYDGFAFDDVSIAEPAVVAQLPADTTVCGDTLVLSPLGTYPLSGYADASWSNGDTALSTSLINTTGGPITDSAFTFTYFDTLGIPTTDTILVSFQPAPNVELGPDSLTFCGNPIPLEVDTATQGAGFYDYTWTTGSTTYQDTATAPGMVSVTVSVPALPSCASTDSVLIVPGMGPMVDLGPDTTLCNGSSLTLNPGSFPMTTTFLWSDNSTDPTLDVTTDGTYSVEVTDSLGCSAADTIEVDTLSAPLASFTADTTGCPDVLFTNTSQFGTSFQWDFGDGITNDSDLVVTHTYAPNTPFTASLEVINACGSDVATQTIECTVTGLNPADEAARVKLYPNPASSSLTFVWPGQQQAHWEIRDMQGRAVVTGQLQTSSVEIPLHDIAAGIYVFRYNAPGGTAGSIRFVVEK